jgi:single-strand DNA-binding protein
MSVNKVILVGNVGKDPEVKHLESNVSVANFTLATSENYTNKSGDKVTSTEWHNIVCWRGLATIAENYIRKGSQVYIEGKLRTRTYDAPDGTKRYATEILADSLQLLGKRTEGQPSEDQKTEQPSTSDPSSFSSTPPVDDLIF